MAEIIPSWGQKDQAVPLIFNEPLPHSDMGTGTAQPASQHFAAKQPPSGMRARQPTLSPLVQLPESVL